MTNQVEVSSITARTGNVQAMAFALKGGAALNSLMSGIADRKAAERMGAIQSMCFLVNTYSDEEQHCIPVVGSKQGPVEDGGTGNKPFDKYSRKETTKDGSRMVPASWYTDVIHSLDEFDRIKRCISYLDGEEVENMAGIPDEYKNLVKTGEATAQKKILRDRISDMRVGLTKGSMLFHHAEEISELNPARIRVKMPWRSEYVLDANGERIKIDGTNEYRTEFRVYGSVIRVQDPAAEMEDKVYSVSSFLQLKPETVAELEQDKRTIVALDETTKRPPKAGDKNKPGTATDVKVPVTVEQVLLQFNTLASGIDQEQDQGERLYAAVLTKASGNDDAARETRISIAKVCMACDSLWTIIRPMYLRDVESAAAAKIAEQTKAAQSK